MKDDKMKIELHTRTSHREKDRSRKRKINRHKKSIGIDVLIADFFLPTVYLDVKPKFLNVRSTVSWSGALRTCTFGGGTGIGGKTLVKTVAGIC